MDVPSNLSGNSSPPTTTTMNACRFPLQRNKNYLHCLNLFQLFFPQLKMLKIVWYGGIHTIAQQNDNQVSKIRLAYFFRRSQHYISSYYI